MKELDIFPLTWEKEKTGIIVCMGKVAYSVLLKLFINGNERCHTNDAPPPSKTRSNYQVHTLVYVTVNVPHRCNSRGWPVELMRFDINLWAVMEQHVPYFYDTSDIVRSIRYYTPTGKAILFRSSYNVKLNRVFHTHKKKKNNVYQYILLCNC